jgi:putative flavoprotein involved in K+ transport
VVAAVEAVEHGRVILADATSVAPEAIIAATGFSMDLDGLVGHLGVLDENGKPRGGFASHVGDGMFAIGYGIPPSGPLRAIRLAATPLAHEVATYLATASSTTADPLTITADAQPAKSPQYK